MEVQIEKVEKIVNQYFKKKLLIEKEKVFDISITPL